MIAQKFGPVGTTGFTGEREPIPQKLFDRLAPRERISDPSVEETSVLDMVLGVLIVADIATVFEIVHVLQEFFNNSSLLALATGFGNSAHEEPWPKSADPNVDRMALDSLAEDVNLAFVRLIGFTCLSLYSVVRFPHTVPDIDIKELHLNGVGHILFSASIAAFPYFFPDRHFQCFYF
jgi:hypothetical protein